MPLFVVHLNDLEEAIIRLDKAANEGGDYAYTNPTTGVRLGGWRVLDSTTPDLELSGANPH